MTPLMPCFPLILGFARRSDPGLGARSLLALMLPCALCFMVTGIAMTAARATFDWPLAPGAGVHSVPPGTLPP